LKEAHSWFEESVDAYSRNEGIAESYYLEALLANKLNFVKPSLTKMNTMAMPNLMT
jgi:hypothetical protein